MRLLIRSITILFITFYVQSCILFKTVEIPETPKPFPEKFFSVEYFYENSFYVTDHDSVKRVLERIFNETEIIFPRTPSFYLHSDKVIMNVNNWEYIGLLAHDKDFYIVTFYLIPKLRLLFFRKKTIRFDYYDRWADMTYVKEDDYTYNKLDSINSLIIEK